MAIAVDVRNGWFGHSSHGTTGYDYDTFTDDLAAVIEGLDLRGVKSAKGSSDASRTFTAI